MARELPITEARARLTQIANDLVDSQETVTVTNRGKPIKRWARKGRHSRTRKDSLATSDHFRLMVDVEGLASTGTGALRSGVSHRTACARLA